MSDSVHQPVKLFQFPRMLGVPNLSPFCCKLETWLRIAGIPYEIVDTPDPRKAPKGKLPFIEDAGTRIADSSVIVNHLKKNRGVDPDAVLDEAQRAIALLVQRTLEEHYAFIAAYTHLIRAEGVKYTGARFETIPAIVRPLVARMVNKRIKQLLWSQGILRHSDAEIMDAAIRDWRAVLAVMSEGPYFFGDKVTSIDAVVFGALATTVLTPIDSPIRDFLRSQPTCVSYAERMRERFFPEFVPGLAKEGRASHRGSPAGCLATVKV